MKNKLTDIIRKKYLLINKKENEIENIRKEIDVLEHKLMNEQNNDVRLVIMCAPSYNYLSKHITENCISIDYDDTNKCIRSCKQQIAFIKSLDIEKILNGNETKTLYTVFSASLNYLGEFVYNHPGLRNKIKIVMYDEDLDGQVTKYNSNGYILDWKMGFLD